MPAGKEDLVRSWSSTPTMRPSNAAKADASMVSSHVIHRLAETILRLAREGEYDPQALQRLALLELQIGPES